MKKKTSIRTQKLDKINSDWSLKKYIIELLFLYILEELCTNRPVYLSDPVEEESFKAGYVKTLKD